MGKNQGPHEGLLAAVYIDGFNLYHPIHEFGEPFLKWINLWRLSELMCERHDTRLVKVVFCTAVPQDDEGKRDRHNTYNAALRAMGVTVLKGHHVINPETGKRTEKQSDINVALSLMLDAEDGVFNCAYLVSADSDQGATARFFRGRHPNKKLFGVAPPTQSVPHKVIDFADDHFVLSKLEIETCVMPMFVKGKTGHPIRRPDAYAPPGNWVHPDQRPRKK